jgi:23S rRNA (uracil1939-C5)-methyltransferase
MPQIEYASNGERDIFIFRILDPLSNDDIKKLSEFSNARNIEIWTQSKGPETVKPLFPERDSEIISYPIAKYELNLEFNPSGFIQINPYINQLMIDKALQLLNLNPRDEVVDFFSGLGNFTLPIAKYAHSVIGIEGSEDLVNLGQKNADLNHLNNVSFQYSNLFEVDVDFVNSLKNKNKWLLDPPRDGAMQLLELISKDTVLPETIVYVSCNPATLARDANILVNDKGYKYQSAGILNMFPHTSHIESISLFTYED